MTNYTSYLTDFILERWKGMALAISVSLLALVAGNLSAEPIFSVADSGLTIWVLIGLLCAWPLLYFCNLKFDFIVFVSFCLFSLVRIEPAPTDVLSLFLLAFGILTGKLSLQALKGTPQVHVGIWGFLMTIFVSLLVVAEVTGSLRYVFISVYMIALAYFVKLYVTTEHRLRTVLFGYLISAVLTMVMVVLGLIGIDPMGVFLEYGSRAQAFFKDSNVLGPFLIPMIIWLIDELWHPHLLPGKTNAKIFGIVLFCAGVLLSFSRAAWGNLILTFGLYVLLSGALSYGNLSKEKLYSFFKVSALTSAILIALVYTFNFGDFLRWRFAALQSYDSYRFSAQRKAIELGLTNVAGIGPGVLDVEFNSPHSLYARTLGEHGIIGFVCLMFVLGYLLISLLRRVGVAKSKSYGLSIAVVTAVFIGHLFNSIVIDTMHWRHFWFLIGLAWVMAAVQRPQKLERFAPEEPVGPDDFMPNATYPNRDSIMNDAAQDSVQLPSGQISLSQISPVQTEVAATNSTSGASTQTGYTQAGSTQTDSVRDLSKTMNFLQPSRRNRIGLRVGSILLAILAGSTLYMFLNPVSSVSDGSFSVAPLLTPPLLTPPLASQPDGNAAALLAVTATPTAAALNASGAPTTTVGLSSNPPISQRVAAAGAPNVQPAVNLDGSRAFYGMQYVPSVDYPVVRELGVEVVIRNFKYTDTPETWLVELDTAQSQGLQVIAWLWEPGWKWVDNQWQIDSQAELFLKTVAPHPALFAIYSLENPYWNGCEGCGYTTAQQQALYSAIKNIVDVPLYSSIGEVIDWAAEGPLYEFAAGICDYCELNKFPFKADANEYRRDSFVGFLNIEIEAARLRDPNAKIVVGLQSYANLDDGLRMPAENEMLDLASLAVNAQVDGLLWYLWASTNPADDSLSKHSELYPTVREIYDTQIERTVAQRDYVTPTPTPRPTDTPTVTPTPTITPTPTPLSAAGIYQVEAVQDATVNSANPISKYGLWNTLDVASVDDQNAVAYLRFDLSDIGGTVTEAKLRLFATVGSEVGYEVRAIDANAEWNEVSIQFDNAPVIGPIIASSEPYAADAWTEVDLTAYVTESELVNKSVNLAITTAGRGGSQFASREQSQSAPQLIIKTGAKAVPDFFYGMEYVPLEELPRAKELGIQVVLQSFDHDGTPTEWRAYLDAAHAEDIQVVPWLWPEGWKWSGTEWTIDAQAEAFLQNVADHPALFAVYSLHEPYWMDCFGCGYTTAQQQQLYSAIKEIVDVPIYSALGEITFWTEYSPETVFADGICDYCDIYYYPFADTGEYKRESMLEFIQENLKTSRELAPNSKIVWAMQGFAFDQEELRMPTADEMVDLAALTYELDFDGAFWYAWTFGDIYQDTLSNHPELLDAVKKIYDEIVIPSQSKE